jgi:uncharacterized protein (TIGR02145 family)
METITFNGLEYGIVQSKTGRFWLDRNLGATKVADAYDDEQSYGEYFHAGGIVCPEGWRVPTKEEWNMEVSTWNANNLQGAFESNLKLPCAGWKNVNEKAYNIGCNGFYWSSSEYGSVYSWFLYFNSRYAYTYIYNYRRFSLSIRCIKDE